METSENTAMHLDLYSVYTEQKYGIAIQIAILILNKSCRVTLDPDHNLLKFDLTSDVDRDPDRNPNPEKMCRVNASQIAIPIEIL